MERKRNEKIEEIKKSDFFFGKNLEKQRKTGKFKKNEKKNKKSEKKKKKKKRRGYQGVNHPPETAQQMVFVLLEKEDGFSRIPESVQS